MKRSPGFGGAFGRVARRALAALRLNPGLLEDLPIRARADHLGRRLRMALEFISTFAATSQPQSNLDAKAWLDRKRIEYLRRWVASSSPDNA